MKHRLILVFILAIIMQLGEFSPSLFSQQKTDSGLPSARIRELERTLPGSWKTAVGKGQVQITFKDDFSYVVGDVVGSYVVGDMVIILTPEGGNAVKYDLDYQTGLLILSGGDLKQSLKMTPVFSTEQPLNSLSKWLFSLSLSNMGAKLWRILSVVVIIIIAVWAIKILRMLSEFIIFTDWGPLKWIGRGHKNQTRTLHSVVLNLIKYIIILFALGRILNELGINYTTYVASLSVIGLAVGFGSQGLVQDLVTGLFIILDNQFSVGDMVEISGQTGIITEVGLRTTRLQNYQGQTAIIPNRNISLVGNYRSGCVKATIDLDCSEPKHLEPVKATLNELLAGLAKQFRGTIRNVPKAAQAITDADGDPTVRLHIEIWPGQQGIVDSQIIPRIKSRLQKKLGMELQGSQVAVILRPPELTALKGWTNPFLKDK